MSSEAIVAAASLVVLLLIQTGTFVYLIGRLSESHATAKKDILDGKTELRTLDTRINSVNDTINKTLVTGRRCSDMHSQNDIKLKSILEQRDVHNNIKLRGILEQWDIHNVHNQKEHKALLDQGKELGIAISTISDCLHKMQNKKEC